MAMTKQETKDKEDNANEEVLDSNQIISQVFTSLNVDIEKLDDLPKNANENTDDLLILLFSDEDIFQDPKSQLKFINSLRKLSGEIGNALDALLEIERERLGVKRETSSMPMPTMAQQPSDKLSPQIFLQNQPPKGGGWADFFSARKWADTMKEVAHLQQLQPTVEITSSKVKDVLDYGRELPASWNETLEFYDSALSHFFFFNDQATYYNQHQELTMHLVKLTFIICTFAKAIAEYRKERFGDRKASVAAGMMWLEGQRMNQQMPPRGAPLSIDPGALRMRDSAR